MKRVRNLQRRLDKLTPDWMRPLPNFDLMTKAQMDNWFRCATDRELSSIILGCQPWEVTREPTEEELDAIIEAYQRDMAVRERSDDSPAVET